MNYLFQFSATGQITAYGTVNARGKRDLERVERDEKVYLENGYVFVEELDDGVVEWGVFRDADGDGLWRKVASGETAERLDAAKQGLGKIGAEPLGFSLLSGAEDTLFAFDSMGRVTHVGELERNGVDWDRVEKNELYQLDGAFLLEQEYGKRGPGEWTLYQDSDLDGLWAEAARGRGEVDLVGLIEQVSAYGLM